jgi:DNA-binding NtrC family response regulator
MANILVVDDDSLVRTILCEVLRLNHHTVMEASNAQEAVDMIDPNAVPDLIIMDYLMPRHNGIECAGQLKALYPSLRIVLISGHFGIDSDGRYAANKHLFADVIVKPFHIKDVVSTVEYALGVGNQKALECFDRCAMIQPT